MITHPDQMAKIREQERDAPIFRDLSQCLWVSYAMEVAKRSPKTVLMKLMREVNDGQYAEKVKLSGINLSGLTEEEKHAQGVFVRNQVDRLVEGLERDYVLTRFSWTEEKTQAASRLAHHLHRDVLYNRDRRMAIIVAWNIIGPPKDRSKVSAHAIMRRYSMKQGAVFRDLARSRAYLNGLWLGASSKLHSFFEKNGVLPEKRLNNSNQCGKDLLELAELG